MNILNKLYTFRFYFIVGLSANQRLYYTIFWDKAALVATLTSQADVELNSAAPSRSLGNRSCACQGDCGRVRQYQLPLLLADPLQKLILMDFVQTLFVLLTCCLGYE